MYPPPPEKNPFKVSCELLSVVVSDLCHLLQIH